MLNFLVDTGSSKNYVQPRLVKKEIPNDTPFFAKSVAGDIKVQSHTYVNLFNLDDKLKFYVMPTLKSFHAILGNDSLRDLNAVIFTDKNLMVIRDRIKIQLKQLSSQSINSIGLQDEHLTDYQMETVDTLVKKFPNLFSEPDEKLTTTDYGHSCL